MRAATSDQIDANIAALRKPIATLEREARDFALPVVSGDEQAVTLLPTSERKFSRRAFDLTVLDDAKATASAHRI